MNTIGNAEVCLPAITKTLLVLGAGTDQCFMIQTAKGMGLKVIAVDSNPQAPGFALADEALVVSNRDVPKIISTIEARGLVVDAVSTMGSDIPHIVAAVAEHFSVPRMPIAAALLTVNKYAMKNAFAAAGILIPPYRLVDTFDQVLDCLKEWRKVVIKPLSQAGSRGVFYFDYGTTNVRGLYERALEFSSDGTLLVEAYLAGDQLSSETLIVEGEAHTVGYADRNYDDLELFLPQIMENGGWIPSQHLNRIDEVNELIRNCGKALGIDTGVIKGDLVLTNNNKIAVIEVAGRLSGGDFCESLVPIAYGINYVATVIQLALGEAIDFETLKPSRCRCVANRYFFPKAGLLKAVSGVETIMRHPKVVKLALWYEPGDELPNIDGHGARAGVFVVEGDNREEVQAVVDEVYKTIKFEIEPLGIDLDND